MIFFFFFKQKTAYEMRISDWSSDVCSSDLELEQALRTRGDAVEVRNAGVSGETTQGGLQRLAFTLDGLPRKPDLVLLGLGANDMLRGLDPAQSDRNLRAMRSEEHTSELQSLMRISYAVFCLKKKKKYK